MVQPKRTVAGVEVEVVVALLADHRRAVRRHRPQPAPEAGLGGVAALGVEVGDDMIERGAPRWPQLRAVAVELGHAADPDPVAQPGDRHLVGLVHDRRFRGAGGIGDRDGERVALDRVDRQVDPDPAQQQRRVAAQRHDVDVAGDGALVGGDAGDLAALGQDAVDPGAVAELDALLAADRGQGVGELEAVAGLVAGQPQPARDLLPDQAQRRLDPDAARRRRAARRARRTSRGSRRPWPVPSSIFWVRNSCKRALAALVIGDAGTWRAARAAGRGCTRPAAPSGPC